MGVKRPEGERYRKPGRPNIHCWVWTDSTTALPGLVLEWRFTAVDRWQAHVVYVDSAALVQQWFPGTQVTRAGVSEPGREGRPY